MTKSISQVTGDHGEGALAAKKADVKSPTPNAVTSRKPLAQKATAGMLILKAAVPTKERIIVKPTASSLRTPSKTLSAGDISHISGETDTIQ